MKTSERIFSRFQSVSLRPCRPARWHARPSQSSMGLRTQKPDCLLQRLLLSMLCPWLKYVYTDNFHFVHPSENCSSHAWDYLKINLLALSRSRSLFFFFFHFLFEVIGYDQARVYHPCWLAHELIWQEVSVCLVFSFREVVQGWVHILLH